MTPLRRLKHVADVRFSSVDKKTVDGQIDVKLCNYTDVYYNERILVDMPFMDATATPDQIAAYTLRGGDVLLTKDSETADDIGVSAYVPLDLPGVLCGYHLAIARPHPSAIDGRYLRWALVSTASRQQLELAATGVTRFGLRQDAVGGMTIPAPPLHEQVAIADYLDAETTRIDGLLSAERRRAGLSLERVAAVTEALVLGREIHGDVVNQPAGPLIPPPSGWAVRRNKTFLREVVDLSAIGDEELLTVSHLSGITPRSEKDVTMFLAESNERYKRVRSGDLVINTMWAWMGALGVSEYEGIVSPAYGVYRFTDPDMEPAYFDALFRSRACVAEMTRYSRGVWTSRLRLYPESFLDLRSLAPHHAEQRRIADAVSELRAERDRLIRVLARSVDLLLERRQALITAAVTGQLDIPGAAA